ncbi:MAG: sugar ABC transporter substrate-binding protein [Actinobacteria bacterium]|nr:sugar ABC transporter substrate-binding protein [Actinomycetota bacterium]
MQAKLSSGKFPRLLILAAALGLIAVLVTACGGGGSSSSESSTAETETTETTEEGEAGGGGGSSELEGKSIGYLDVFATAPIEIRFQKAFKEAAGHLGWSVRLQDAAGEPEKALTGARNLINSGVDAIVTSSVPGEWILPIEAEAKEKNIPIIAMITKEPPQVFSGQVLESQEATSEKMAEQIKEELPGGGEVAIFFEEEQQSLIERTEFLEEAFEGSNIKVVATQNVPAAENAKAQKYTTDILTSHPDIAAFITTSDILSPEVLAGLRTAGNSKAKVYGWYADSANAETMKANPKQFIAVVDSDIAKAGWITAEELAHFFTGGEIKKEQDVETEAVMVAPSEVTPGMLAEEGPVPFSQIGPPFYKEWESKFSS